MKFFNFSALKLMTSLCLLLFVSLAATRLQAQSQGHTKTYAIHEVDDSGEPKFSLWNKQFKQYYGDMGGGGIKLSAQVSSDKFDLEKLSGDWYQIEQQHNSIACCTGNDDLIYIHSILSTTKDEVQFVAEGEKDVYRIKFKHNGAYLTAAGNGQLYGTTIKMGDHQLWMITGR